LLNQQLVKVQKFREAQLAVDKAHNDEQDLSAAVEGLSQALETELDNLNTDKDQMTVS